jgi:hypothetical protein
MFFEMDQDAHIELDLHDSSCPFLNFEQSSEVFQMPNYVISKHINQIHSLFYKKWMHFSASLEVETSMGNTTSAP